MKRNFYFLLMAALVFGLSLSVTSCKSDDDNNNDDEGEEFTDGPQNEQNEAATKFWNVVSQLVDIDEMKEEPKKVASVGGDVRQVPSPIQGSVIDIKVKVGDIVKKGDVLLVIEAMKLENAVPSPYNGEVAEILVNKGQSVAAKEIVVTIK